MSKRKQFTNEELGIDPARERRTIAIVVGTMVALLIIGMIFMFIIIAYEAATHEEPEPEQPFMEFSAVHTLPNFRGFPWCV